jgi:methyl-accepting chemotaxis protein
MNSTTPHRENVARVDMQSAQFEDQISQLLRDAAQDNSSDSDTVAPAPWRLPSGWTLRRILLAAGIAVVALVALQLFSGDPAKTTTPTPKPALLAQTATADGSSPAAILLLAKQLESVSLDLTTLSRRVEQLEATQDRLRDSTNVANQFKASQEQMTGVIAKLSEQLNASQEQISRNNASVAEQLKANQEQLVTVLAQTQQDRQTISAAAATPPQQTAAPTPTPKPKPAPSPASPQTTVQARAHKPPPPSKPSAAGPLGFLLQ